MTGPAHLFVFILVYTAIAFANITAEPEKDKLYHPSIALQPETCRVVHHQQALAAPAISCIPYSGLQGNIIGFLQGLIDILHLLEIKVCKFLLFYKIVFEVILTIIRFS